MHAGCAACSAMEHSTHLTGSSRPIPSGSGHKSANTCSSMSLHALSRLVVPPPPTLPPTLTPTRTTRTRPPQAPQLTSNSAHARESTCMSLSSTTIAPLAHLATMSRTSVMPNSPLGGPYRGPSWLLLLAPAAARFIPGGGGCVLGRGVWHACCAWGNPAVAAAAGPCSRTIYPRSGGGCVLGRGVWHACCAWGNPAVAAAAGPCSRTGCQGGTAAMTCAQPPAHMRAHPPRYCCGRAITSSHT